jgi:hypothetical protein
MLQRTLFGSLATLSALCALALTGCGQVATTPVVAGGSGNMEARVSPAARDKICQMLIKEYNGIQWYQDAEKKQMLLESIAGTGSDLAVDLLIKEYEGIQWYQDRARKMMFLDLLKQLAATPTDPQPRTELADGLEAARATAKAGPSRKALGKMAATLKKDLELKDAPDEAKSKIKAILIQIISPNTGR